ncbi:MAG: hypothetical protein Q9195_004707 [Heterodermia aff. obscurata]
MPGSVPNMPGVKADGHMAMAFRQEVADLLHRHQTSFPGAQPVSFAAKHILELQRQDYYVCEKSDGIRCLMYMTGDSSVHPPQEIVYLIDRKNDYYWAQGLHFPVSSERPLEFHTGTLVDGELVNDSMPDGSIQLNYLVFDCLVLDGSSLMHRTLDKRLAYFREKVYSPYKALYAKYPEEVKYLPFTVKFKKMEFGYASEMMFRDILPNLPHGNDGLIFTCRNSPYQPGTDPHILKWKPAEENSLDFRLFFEWAIIEPSIEDVRDGITEPYPDYYSKPTFHLFVHRGPGSDELYATMTVDDDEWEYMKSLNKPLDERIVECYLDKRGQWRFLRFRDDKLEANHVSMIESAMESIRDGVTEQDLIACSRKIREEWKKREANEKAEAARKGMNGHAAPAGGQREVSMKRKLENGDDEAENAKRHHSAHHQESSQQQ